MKVKDKKTGKLETVVERTVNSFLVTRTKLTDKGIDCKNWFDEKRFKERFEMVDVEELV